MHHRFRVRYNILLTKLSRSPGKALLELHRKQTGALNAPDEEEEGEDSSEEEEGEEQEGEAPDAAEDKKVRVGFVSLRLLKLEAYLERSRKLVIPGITRFRISGPHDTFVS